MAQNITKPNIVAPSGVEVNSFTGSLFCKRTDMVILSPGLSIDMSFTYNSVDRATDVGFGKGWVSVYNQSYIIDSAGGITVKRSDGRRDHFALVNGAFIAPKGIFDVLTEYQTGKLRLKAIDGTQYFFENAGHKKLTRITDRNNNKTIISYSGVNIASVSDSIGHVVNFIWAGNRLAEIQAVAGSSTRSVKYEYNTQGFLVQVKRPHGVVLAYSYGANLGLSLYTDGNGNNTGITYNSNNAVVKLLSCDLEQRIAYNPDQRKTYLTEVNNSATLATTYEFDVNSRLVRKSGNCCGYNTAYEYDQANNVTKVTDGNGGVKVYTYDSRGNVLAATDQLGKTTLYTYTAAFNDLATLTDKKGNQSTYSYDANGNLTQETDALSHSMLYTYNSQGNRLTSTDKKGYTTRYAYDQFGNPALVVGPQGDSLTLVNDPWGNILSRTDPMHHSTSFGYDSLFRVKNITDALQGTTQFTYDANDNRLSITDARGKTTNAIYNWRNKPVNITDALSHSISLTYDGMGSMLSYTDANGHTSGFSYDNLNRLITSANALGEQTGYDYDGAGNKKSITYPNGNTVRMDYDALNRVTKVTDALGTIAQYSYDANSNKIAEQDGKGNTITYQYDVLDRALSKTDGLGNAWNFVYDVNNNLVQQTDRKGNTSNYTYDSLDRRRTVTDALNHTTQQLYDKAGNLVALIDANSNATHYSYDALNRLTQELFADNTSRSYTYDSASNLKTRTDNMGQLTQFFYDDVNRRVLQKYTATEADTFAYDNTGLLITAKNGSATVNFGYDAANRVAFEILNGKTTSYGYNIAARKRTITYPGGRVVERQTDVRDQLNVIKENGLNIAAYEYDEAGRNTKRSYQNGTVSNLAYNANSQITTLDHNPAHFVDLNYGYDAEGNPTGTQFQHTSGHNEQYSYDALNQLTGFTKGGTPAGSYNYDAVGNRTTAQLNGIPASYTVNNMNAYTSLVFGSSFSLSYDLNGNLTNDGIKNYAYDRENRLRSVNGGSTATYAYDALGRRIRKTTTSDTILYYYDTMQIIEERNSSDSLKASYVWGRWLDDIVSMRRNGQSYYYHTNMLGSIIAVTNSAGQVAEQYEYDAYGKAIVHNASFAILPGGTAIGNTWLYTGRQLDTETRLYYYRARYYDAVHGRFMQRDPLGYSDGMGTYAYVGNKPLHMIDPFGTEKVCCDGSKCCENKDEDDPYGELREEALKRGQQIASVPSNELGWVGKNGKWYSADKIHQRGGYARSNKVSYKKFKTAGKYLTVVEGAQLGKDLGTNGINSSNTYDAGIFLLDFSVFGIPYHIWDYDVEKLTGHDIKHHAVCNIVDPVGDALKRAIEKALDYGFDHGIF